MVVEYLLNDAKAWIAYNFTDIVFKYHCLGIEASIQVHIFSSKHFLFRIHSYHNVMVANCFAWNIKINNKLNIESSKLFVKIMTLLQNHRNLSTVLSTSSKCIYLSRRTDSKSWSFEQRLTTYTNPLVPTALDYQLARGRSNLSLSLNSPEAP